MAGGGGEVGVVVEGGGVVHVAERADDERYLSRCPGVGRNERCTSIGCVVFEAGEGAGSGTHTCNPSALRRSCARPRSSTEP